MNKYANLARWEELQKLFAEMYALTNKMRDERFGTEGPRIIYEAVLDQLNHMFDTKED